MAKALSLNDAPKKPPKIHVTLAFRVNDFCSAMGFGRSTFYELVKRGEIRTVVIGGRRLVPAAEADRLLSCQSPSFAVAENSATS